MDGVLAPSSGGAKLAELKARARCLAGVCSAVISRLPRSCRLARARRRPFAGPGRRRDFRAPSAAAAAAAGRGQHTSAAAGQPAQAGELVRPESSEFRGKRAHVRGISARALLVP